MLFSTVAIEGSETVQVVWPVTFCSVPLLTRVACSGTVPPTATRVAAGLIENAFELFNAFGLFKVVPQPAIKAASINNTHICNSVGGVRMLATFSLFSKGRGSSRHESAQAHRVRNVVRIFVVLSSV